MALGVPDYEEIACELEDLLKPEVPAGLRNKLKMLPKLARLAKVPPRTVSSGRSSPRFSSKLITSCAVLPL